MSGLNPGISLTWLLRLRWITAVAQAAAILVSSLLFPGEMPVLPLLGLVAFGALSNLALMRRLRRPDPAPPALPGLVLGLDILLLTGLLYGSGGPANPFTVIYLVHITLAAVVLRGLWAWALGLLSTAGYGSLFFWNVHIHSLGHMDHGGGMSLHLVGMWVAFVITAGLIAAFVGRVTEALRRRDEELSALRDLSARHARLAALTTLAAGVAHELGTPLGTIAVAAKELQREAADLGQGGTSVLADATLIRQEVDRCRRILDGMAGPTGTNPGEDFMDLRWPDLEQGLREGWSGRDLERIAFDWPGGSAGPVPRAGLLRAVRALVANALEATPEPGRIQVKASRDGRNCCIEVVDPGGGMTPEVLARAGEPFFTTKPAGAGMGLGLFLARTFAEQLGGDLQVRSSPGAGTTVRLRWPQVARG